MLILNARTGLALLLLPALGQAGCGCVANCDPPTGPSCDIQNIRTESLPDGVVGRPYSFRLEHNCSPENDYGFIDVRWQVDGSLPPGMTLSLGGALSGTPTTDGDYSLPISVSACGFLECTRIDSRTLALVVRAIP